MRHPLPLLLLVALAACTDVPLPSDPTSLVGARSPVLSGLKDAEWVTSTTGIEMLVIGQVDGRMTSPTAINEPGQVVGWYEANTAVGPRAQAFVWENGQFTPLGTLGGPSSFTTFISNDGVIVGWAMKNFEDERTYPVVWERSENGYTIRELRGLVDVFFASGIARSMNAAGEIVGAYTSSMFFQHAVKWDASGRPIDLGVLPNTLASSAWDINNSGTIVGASQSFDPFGSHSTIWTGGGTTPTPITLPDNGDFASRNGEASRTINDAGEFIGSHTIEQSPFNTVGFVFRDGAFHELPPLEVTPFTTFAAPMGINQPGDIAGWTTTTGNPRAVVWPKDGGGPIDLGVAPIDGNFSMARSINNRGLVAGISVTFSNNVVAYSGAIWRWRR